MIRRSHIFFAAILLAMAACGPAPEAPVPDSAPAAEGPVADTVFINGKILTVDNDFSVVEALAVSGERIVAVGDNDSVNAFAGATTQVVDLKGQTVIPGLIDNHMHFIRAAQRWNLQARIDGISSRAEALNIIAGKAASMPAGDWLMVQGGWRENQFADQPGGFTLEELDQAAPNNPLFLQITYQTVYANTLALEAVGFSPAEGARHDGPPLISPSPPYGLLNEQMPAVSEAQIEQNMMDFIGLLNRAGLTSVYDVGRPPEGDITMVERLSQDGPLPIRVWHTLKYEAYNAEDADAAVALIESNQPNNTNDYYGLLGLGEHVYLPMFDLPGMTEPYGPDIVSEFMKIATAAAENGFHIHEHTMLDPTIQTLLGPYEELNEQIPLAPLRWTWAHTLTISDESIERAKALGTNIAIHSVSMYGPPPLQPPVRSIQESGIPWGLGTDATIVAHYQPFITLGWIVSGRSINGQLVNGDQTVSREDALIAHTRTNAYLMFKEDDLGTLEPGKLADLVVLDRDYMTIPAEEIFDIEPVMTVVGGRIVYEAP